MIGGEETVVDQLELTGMSRYVQKFGGTSIADVSKIKRAAQIAVEAVAEGHQVVTVVSAMGHTTDNLITLAGEVSEDHDSREMDMLMATGEQVSIALMCMAIQSLGYKARSFTGAQAGIITDNQHGLAKILEVRPQAIEEALSRGEIAVVAGFQGLSLNNELTTLGRGGSDTTAVALASALKADRCDIYTDVDGVYTADPRILSTARRLPSVSYEEMLELSATGSQVLAVPSVELAMESKVTLRVRPTFRPRDLGTLIGHISEAPAHPICGISCDMNQVAFTLRSRRLEKVDRGATSIDGISTLLSKLQELNIPTDMLMMLAHEDTPAQEVAFTVDRRYQKTVEKLLESLSEVLGLPQVEVTESIARISVVGTSLATQQEITTALFEALQSGDIPVRLVSTGDIRVSIVVNSKHAADAVKLIHDKFSLAEERVVA